MRYHPEENKICQLFKIRLPIIQAGMVWCSGWRLAAAVSEAGALGIIGAGSMYPDVLEEHLKKFNAACRKPFAVNIPLLYPDIEELIDLVISYKVPLIFTSAGSPATWTPILKKEGIRVVHVVSSSKFAIKAESAGCDAVVAEGFEAGGHNGREETTTMCLIPKVRTSVSIPLIAAGGIYSGRSMLAAMVLGADAVQIGTRFVASEESSAHEAFKNTVLDAGEGDTILSMKKLVPVRLIKNKFWKKIQDAEDAGADMDELKKILGRARAKKGMFEGDMEEGELEIGQVSANINKMLPAAEIVKEIWDEYLAAIAEIKDNTMYGKI